MIEHTGGKVVNFGLVDGVVIGSVGALFRALATSVSVDSDGHYNVLRDTCIALLHRRCPPNTRVGFPTRETVMLPDSWNTRCMRNFVPPWKCKLNNG